MDAETQKKYLKILDSALEDEEYRLALYAEFNL